MKVAGIRFRKAGKIYYFDPCDIDMKPGEHVIVETVRGIEYGTVVLADKEVAEDQVVQPLKKVLRLATEEDKETEVQNKEKEREAYRVCKSKIIKHELDMKLIDCEYTFDNNKLLFYFTADGRVDFRELVKDLASVFKTRIELRQIGVRDETKMIGSIGICGRTLCCHGHLADFHPVSIKMAKDQNLSLNPTKISGVCGRLMCCLKYEEETYKELNRNLPRSGNKVRIKYSGEIAEVINTNIIRQLVKVVVRKEDGTPEIMELKLEELDLQREGKFQKRPPVKKQQPKDVKEAPTDSNQSVGAGGDEESAEDGKSGTNKRPRDSRNQNSNRSQGNKNKSKQGGTRNNSNRNKNTAKPKTTSNMDSKPDKNQNDKGDGAKSGEKKNNNNRSRNRRPRNRSNKPKQNDGQKKE